MQKERRKNAERTSFILSQDFTASWLSDCDLDTDLDIVLTLSFSML